MTSPKLFPGFGIDLFQGFCGAAQPPVAKPVFGGGMAQCATGLSGRDEIPADGLVSGRIFLREDRVTGKATVITTVIGA